MQAIAGSCGMKEAPEGVEKRLEKTALFAAIRKPFLLCFHGVLLSARAINWELWAKQVTRARSLSFGSMSGLVALDAGIVAPSCTVLTSRPLATRVHPWLAVISVP